jgi:hypothetical protein
MQSKLAKLAELDLIESMKRLTPEQRLRGFVNHSKFMVKLTQAGEQFRAQQRRKRS